MEEWEADENSGTPGSGSSGKSGSIHSMQARWYQYS